MEDYALRKWIQLTKKRGQTTCPFSFLNILFALGRKHTQHSSQSYF